MRSLVDAMVMLSQGYVVHSALFGLGDPAAYLSGVAELLHDR